MAAPGAQGSLGIILLKEPWCGKLLISALPLHTITLSAADEKGPALVTHNLAKALREPYEEHRVSIVALDLGIPAQFFGNSDLAYSLARAQLLFKNMGKRERREIIRLSSSSIIILTTQLFG